MINTSYGNKDLTSSYSEVYNYNNNNNNNRKNSEWNQLESDINMISNIRIGTHNVRGFNREYKRNEFMDFYRDINIDIIGLNETKLNKKTGKNLEKLQKKDDTFLGYRIWFEGIDEESTKTGGVALAIKEQFAKHVTEIGRYMGRLIWMRLKYKGKPDLLIINIYMNSDIKDKIDRKLLIKKLKILLRTAEDLKHNVILLGDLNADREKWEQQEKLQNKEKYKILEVIKNANLFDTQRITTEENKEIEKTWIKNANTKRRLDYIWVNDDLLDKLNNSEVWNIEPLESDHKLLSIDMDGNLLHRLQRKKSREKKRSYIRIKYLTDDMNEEDWEKFKDTMDKNINKSNVIPKMNKKLMNNNNTEMIKHRINNIWNLLEKIIKDTMDSTIKKKEIIKSEYNYVKNKKIFPSRILSKILGKIVRVAKKDNLYKWGYNFKKSIIEKIENFNQSNPGCVPEIQLIKENLLLNNNEWLIKSLSEIMKKLRPKMKIEETMWREKQIKEAIETRIKELEIDKKSFLNKSLERSNNRIGINRLLVNINGDRDLITDENEVLKYTANHFKSITDRTGIQKEEETNIDWLTEYFPRGDIDGLVYSNLMSEIEEEEWELTLRSLKRGSAPGFSKIEYIHLQKCSSKMKKLMKQFYNEILKYGIIPDNWLKGIIYPIPKTEEWELELSKTRPITLLECPRKILFKILTNRLTKILGNNKNILGEYNFAALPGSSTIEPINILNNIIEDAREKNKELWVLFQDMSKAYDYVNREHLSKALERIKIPNLFIKLIENSFNGRTNRVITDYGLTEEYKMVNGIDQGEIISPILWVIYYNPLFEKIDNIGNLGYKLEFNGKPIGNEKCFNKINEKIEINNLTYMDDTTWVSSNKEKMLKQLEIANSFNNFNGIVINKKKSELIVINGNKEEVAQGICYGGKEEVVMASSDNKSVRFLGVYIAEKDNRNFIKNLIKKEINQIYYMLNKKKLTPEQIVYIINAVLIPRIEYKTNILILTENEVNNLFSKIRRLVRNKIGIANTSPNAFLYRKNMFKLVNFLERQEIKQIELLNYKIVDNNLLGITTKIRLKQLQFNEWLHDNPLEIWNYNDILTFKNNLLGQILCLMNKKGLGLNTNSKENNWKIEGGTIPILDILRNDYRKHKESLKNKNIMYVEQLIHLEDLSLKYWYELNNSSRGRIPTWWNLISEKIKDKNERNRKIKKEIIERLNDNIIKRSENTIKNGIILPNTKLDGRKNNWLVTHWKEKTLIVGKYIPIKNEKLENAAKIKMIHYPNKLNKETDELVIKECKDERCEIGEWDKDKKECVLIVQKNNVIRLKEKNKTKIKNDIDNTWLIKSNVNVIKQDLIKLKRLNQDIEKIKNKESQKSTDNVIIKIDKMVERKILLDEVLGDVNESECQQHTKKMELLEIYSKIRNLHKKNLIAYTDGSLKNNYMGMGWTIWDDEEKEKLIEFKGSNKGFPSSTKAELMAILTLILVLEKGTEIEIYTDSLNAIQNIGKFDSLFSKRKKLKEKNYRILQNIKCIQDRLNIKCKLTKVKAHDGILGNEEVDVLAKEGIEEMSVSNKNVIGTEIYDFNWYGIKVEEDIKSFLINAWKEQYNKEENNLSRMKNLDEEVDKNLSFEVWKGKNTKEQKVESLLKQSEKKCFKIKRMLDELPSLEKLKIRKKELYKKDLNCVRCNLKKENTSHIWSCIMARNELGEIEREVKSILWEYISENDNIKEKDVCFEKLYKYTRSEATLKDHNTAENVKFYKDLGKKDLFRTYLWDKRGSLDTLLKGWVPIEFTKILLEYQIKKEMSSIKKLLVKIGELIEEKLYDIWKDRNKKVNDWEKENDISLKDKKQVGKKERNKGISRNRIKIGRKDNYAHRIDDEIYFNIKKRIGLYNEDENFSLDKRVENIGL